MVHGTERRNAISANAPHRKLRRNLKQLALFWLLSASLWPCLATAAGTPVTVKQFSAVGVFPRFSAPGSTVSLNDSQVSAEVSGVIRAIRVKPGDVVEAGETLVNLDCRDHELAAKRPEAQLQAAVAERKLASYRAERAETLRKRGAMSVEEFQRRKAEAARAAAEVRRLQALVDENRLAATKCEIKAPFRAVVVKRFASVGELASPGTPLLRIVDTDAIEVSSHVQEQDLPALRSATQVRFASGGVSRALKLRSVVPVLDRRRSSYEVRLEFDGDPVPVGQSGRVEWRTGAPRVPAYLLVQRDGRLGVFLAEDRKARFHVLDDAKPGQPAVADIPGDARIVVDGRYGLEDGESLRPVQD